MKKKDLLESAPWRGEEDAFEDAKLRATRPAGGGHATMYVPKRKAGSSKLKEDNDALEIDPELRYSFQRNFQVTSLPPRQRLADALHTTRRRKIHPSAKFPC